MALRVTGSMAPEQEPMTVLLEPMPVPLVDVVETKKPSPMPLVPVAGEVYNGYRY
jgi:hypothetical protein